MSFVATGIAGLTAAEIAAAAAAAQAAAATAAAAAAPAAAGAGGAFGGLLSTAGLGSSAAAGAAPGVSTGLLGSGITGAQIMGGLKDAGSAAGSLGAINSLMPGEEQLQHAQMSQGSPAGPQTVAQIYQASQQATQDQLDKAMQDRMQRRQMWG